VDCKEFPCPVGKDRLRLYIEHVDVKRDLLERITQIPNVCKQIHQENV
jgi:hypothetical protein